MTEFDEALGRRLRRWREDAGFSQAALADMLGDDQGYISRLESGQRRISVETLVAYLEALGLPLEEKAADIASISRGTRGRSLWGEHD